jgi:surface protein
MLRTTGIIFALILTGITTSFAQDFYLDPNGITIKCENASMGDVGTVNGIEYLAADNSTILSERILGRDMGTICTSHVTDLGGQFRDIGRAVIGDVRGWDVSSVTNMSSMFLRAENFNQDIGAWDVSSVTDMSSMFAQTLFNQNIGNWDVSSVNNMAGMFRSAEAFNQELENWDVSSVTNMEGMFSKAYKASPYIGNWNVSAVTNMGSMFSKAYNFNDEIGGWDVSSVTNMEGMFSKAYKASPYIVNWNVSAVTNMGYMFEEANAFNQNIGNWNVSAVTNMSSMFGHNTVFNQNIGSWDVSSVIDMARMFYRNTAFDQNIGNWDVSSVTDFELMFGRNTVFNTNIGSWDVSSATRMRRMFIGASAFDQDLSNWCPSLILSEPEGFAVGSKIENQGNYHPKWGCIPGQLYLSASLTQGPAPLSVEFQASFASPSTTDGFTFLWDYRDGQTQTGEIVTHTFSSMGDFMVLLTASDGTSSYVDSLRISVSRAVANDVFDVPQEFKLYPSFPNPFNPTTTIGFDVPDTSPVSITVTDLLGKQVASLVTGKVFSVGYHTVQFNAEHLTSGTYFVLLRTASSVQQQAVVLLK